jgi:hypothetical protein
MIDNRPFKALATSSSCGQSTFLFFSLLSPGQSRLQGSQGCVKARQIGRPKRGQARPAGQKTSKNSNREQLANADAVELPQSRLVRFLHQMMVCAEAR